MFLFFSFALALIASLFPLPSIAQQGFEQSLSPYLGTINVSSSPAYAGGELTGCHLEFGALVRDWTYRKGAFLRVGGAVGISGANKKLVVTLKTIVHELDPVTGNFVPSPPASAYFIDGARTTKSTLVGNYPSDTPGGLFSVFQLVPSAELVMSGLSEGKITTGFARILGGKDILVSIETDVEDTTPQGVRVRSQRMVDDFFGCVVPLLNTNK